MRIVLASRGSLPHSVGGGEVHMLALAKAFKAQGHDASILTVEGIAKTTTHVNTGEVDGVTVDYIRIPKRLSKYYRDPDLTKWAAAWFSEQKVDVLHLFLFSNLLGLIPAARQHSIPVFLTALEFSYFCRRFDLVRGGKDLC